MKKKTQENQCPCDSGKPLSECCGRYHSGVAAPDAEQLMRSRYSAYVLGLEAYLLATWHASTRPSTLDMGKGPTVKWIGLEVKSFSQNGDSAIVSFVARFKEQGRAGKLIETSRFVQEDGRWYYLAGCN